MAQPERTPRPETSATGSNEASLVSRLDKAERELSDFSYIVSHDLAAAFRHVAEFSNLLQNDLGAGATTAQQAYSGHVQRATEKCRRMMDQLLVYSRIQQRPLALTLCDATRAAEMAALQLSAEVRANDAEITIEPLGVYVMDIDLMTAAFKHAIDNSIKFRRADVPPRIVISEHHGPDAWVVRIRDNGVGVALERQDKLFRMFYQDYSEGLYSGVGAGLTMCRRILRRHGGDCAFLPCADGACLEFVLPPVDRLRTAEPNLQ